MDTPATEPAQLDLVTIPSTDASQLSIPGMLKQFIAQGVTADNVAAFEKLVGLYERLQDKDAEKQFNAAFVALQADMPVIVASTVIPNRGKYERFEDVMRQIGPLLVKHGFTVSFSMDFKESRVLEICTLKHASGHSQSNSFAVRTGKADTDTQADCKAATTAKRNALLNCLNVVIRQDVLQDEEGDASLEGERVTWEQAQYLAEQVKETGSDEVAFLKFAGASKYEEIQASKYDRLTQALEAKTRR